MSQNRLHLDFSLTTQEERRNFLDAYLQQKQFIDRPPSEDELSTMADYLLWGKNDKGQNAKQEGIDLRSKHGTWDQSPVDSLEQLLEQPTFSEAQISPLGSTRYPAKKEAFSRKEALANASPFIRETLLTLFNNIDRLDYMVEEYDLLHGRRTKPIRVELAKKFTEEEKCTMRDCVTHWNQYNYLKQRHQLVELRREQYTIRDSFHKTLPPLLPEFYTEENVVDFDAGIEVLPLGLWHDGVISGAIFRTWRELNPQTVPEELLPDISKLYWRKKQFAPGTSQRWFDFRELEHVYQLLNQQIELQNEANLAEIDSNLAPLLKTLQFYIEQAALTDIQREILDMKLHKKKNTDIAWDINHKYGKTYTANYISTIFRQKIIPRINDAAIYHEKVIGNIFFPEEFKACSTCGEIMMRDAENFTRKSRSADGFSSRCKKCEKKARQGG